MRLLFIVLGLFAATLLAQSTWAQDGATEELKGQLTGRVLLPDGSPALDAVVLAKSAILTAGSRTAEVMTDEIELDEEGRFTYVPTLLEGMSNTIINVEAQLPGHIPFGRLFIFRHPPGIPRSSLEQYLKQEVTIEFAVGSAFSGQVLNTEGDPIPNATLTAYVSELHPESEHFVYTVKLLTETDEEGKFSYKELPAGKEVHVTVSGEGYVSKDVVVNAPLEDFSVTLSESGSALSGMVFNEDTDATIPDVELKLSRFIAQEGSRTTISVESDVYTVTSKEDGSFAFVDISAGRYRLEGKAEGLFLKPTEALTVTLADGEKRIGHEVIMNSGFNAEITVRDDAKAPLAGVRIEVVQSYSPDDVYTHSATTNAEGIARLSGLDSSRPFFNARFIKDGYDVSLPNNRASSDGRIQFNNSNGERDFKAEVTMSNARLRGRVVTRDGKPSAGTKVSRVGLGGSMRFHFDQSDNRTDQNGYFDIAALPDFQGLLHLENRAGLNWFSNPITATQPFIDDTEIVEPEPGSLGGIVLNSKAEPIRSAEVSIFHVSPMVGGMGSSRPAGTVKTNPEGRFVVNNLAPGSHSLSVTAKGYAAVGNLRYNVDSGKARDDIKITMEEPNFLAGQFVDEDGKAVRDVRGSIFASTSGGHHHQVEADRNGRFRIDDLPNATFMLTVGTKGGSQSFNDVILNKEDNIFVLKKPEPDVKLIGSVVNERTGEPIGDGSVMGDAMHSSEIAAIKEGRFELTRKAGDTVRISFKADGFRSSDPVTVTFPQNVEEFERTFTIGQSGRVIGRTVTAEGEPVSDVAIFVSSDRFFQAYGTLGEKLTGADGTFEFDDMPSGNIYLKITPKEHGATTRSASIQSGETRDLGDIVLDEGASLLVRLVRNVEGKRQPATGVTVRLSGQIIGHNPINMVSDENGEVFYTGLPDGRHNIGLDGRSESVSLVTGFLVEREIVLGEGSITISLTVNGKLPPVHELYVSGYQPSGGSYLSNPEQDGPGVFKFKNIAVGTYTMTARLQPYSSSDIVQLEVTENEDSSYSADLEAGSVSIRVVRGAEKAAVSGAKSELFFNDRQLISGVSSGSDGLIQINPLIAGDYRIDVSHPEYGQGTATFSVSREQRTEIEVALAEGPVGTIRSLTYRIEDGLPLFNAYMILAKDGNNRNSSHHTGRDSRGALVLENVPVGVYTASITAAGYSTSKHEITVAEGGTVVLEDVLYRIGHLVVTIVTPEGRYPGAFTANLIPLDASSLQEPIERRATHETMTFSDLWPGDYRVDVRFDTGKELRLTGTVHEGQTTRLTEIVEPQFMP